MNYSADIKKAERKFLPANFQVTNWEVLEPFFKTLLERDLQNIHQLETWLTDLSELEAVVSEDACWRQIRMTCDTANKELEAAFNFFFSGNPAAHPALYRCTEPQIAVITCIS